MGRDARASFADVPIVGAAFEILTSYPTIIVRCACEAKGIVVLVGSGSSGPCPTCGKVFGVGKVGASEVGVVRMAEGAPV